MLKYMDNELNQGYINIFFRSSWCRLYCVLIENQLNCFADEIAYKNSPNAHVLQIRISHMYLWHPLNFGLMIRDSANINWKIYLEQTSSYFYKAFAKLSSTYNKSIDEDMSEKCESSCTCSFKLISTSLLSETKRYTGWLTKRGRIIKSWRRRYFVLADRILAYFAVSTEGIGAKRVAVVKYVEQSDEIENGIIFHLHTGRKLVTYAASDGDRIQWLEFARVVFSQI